jgi:hypothetical protein
MQGTITRGTHGTRAALLALCAIWLAGCNDQGPVELVDGNQPEPIELMTPPPHPAPGMELGAADTTGIGVVANARASAHVMVQGSRFDMPDGVKRLSLARAIFFDRDRPVDLGLRGTCYMTDDVGAVVLNGSPMLKLPKGTRGDLGDTVLGPQYLILSEGPPGFTFEGSTHYTWAGTGAGDIGPFTLDITSPPEIALNAPASGTAFSAGRDLVLRWTGGGSRVYLVISIAGPTRETSPVVLSMKFRVNRGWIVIPQRMLQFLPLEREEFVFTLISDVVAEKRVDGYPDPVLVQALTTHSILLTATD